MLDEIQDNVRNKNWDNVSRIAHKLKSSLGPLQVTRMITLATAIEQNSKQKNSVEDISSLYKELQHQYKVVKPLIELELAKAKRISNGFVLS